MDLNDNNKWTAADLPGGEAAPESPIPWSDSQVSALSTVRSS